MSKPNRHLEPVPGEIIIESLSHEGRGVARIDGKTVFVDGAITSESVHIQYTCRKSRYDEAEVIDVITASEYRDKPGCAHYEICGGCSMQHIHIDYQILHKQQVVLEQLSHIGNISPLEILPPLTGKPWGYRYKARLGVKFVKNKDKVLVGFREKRKPSFIADIEECEVLHPSIGKRISNLKILIENLSIHSAVPQLEIAIGDSHPVIVVRHLEPLSQDDIALLKVFSEDTGIIILLQGGGVNSITTLSGAAPDNLSYSLPVENVTIQFSPMDFTQVNHEINGRMVHEIIHQMELKGDDKVLDLFCGLGNFTLPMARKAATVTGIEGALSQVERARNNAIQNNVTNVEFKCMDLYADGINQCAGLKGYNKLMLDPPRSGAIEVINTIDFGSIEKIVYVSCNPSTLARDAGILVNEKGYKLAKLRVIDMFPHTSHVESVAVFNR
jgi:23S rRNA (uracil1939-C5)-methyltransferase